MKDMCSQQTDLDQLSVNTIRMLSVDAIEQANSGHPGLPLGAAPVLYALWKRFLRHNPKNPKWFDRDRFILSPGHGSALLYSLLHLTGYDISLEEIKNFRQMDSKTPGHPEYGIVPGVECTTGPLGQGFAMGVGMAIAEQYLAKLFNKPDFKVIDHFTYALVSDGDLMEGISAEAASIAGHLKLGKLIYLYDDNDISIDGSTDLTFTENVRMRFEACDWQVLSVDDGNDIDAVASAVAKARENLNQPSLIIVRTHIGYGSPKQDTSGVHGAPLGANALKATKEFFGFPLDKSFYVPEEASRNMLAAVGEGKKLEQSWNTLLAQYEKAYPEAAKLLKNLIAGLLPEGWDTGLNALQFPAEKAVATRSASGTIMNALAKYLPNFIGGSADLGSSVKTVLKDAGDLDCRVATATTGRNMYFGVREHAMGSVVNGMALHGGILPFCSTFFVFSDYMRPAIRLAALMDVHSIFVFSHDSIGLGEDGPTHQPVEHLISLRAMPNLTLFRPADANETAAAWRFAITCKKPVAIVLSRQDLPILNSSASPVEKGAYILSEAKGDMRGIIISSGSEAHLAVEAQNRLAQKGLFVRVVSMPSWDLFEQQTKQYKDTVLPPSVKCRLAVEAGSSFGWERYTGDCGAVIGIDKFGASAPAEQLFEQYGITADNICKRMETLLS